jgi:hypothetical protein
MILRTASPKALLLASAGLAAASFLSFLLGATLLSVGLKMPGTDAAPLTTTSADAVEGQEPVAQAAPETPGILSRLRTAATSVIPGGDGPASPGYSDGHPVGLYLMTRYWIATRSLEKAVWYFTRDGRVYVDLEDGFSDDILAKHKGRHGTVSVDGDRMTIAWSNGQTSTARFEKADGGFNYDMGLFAPVKGFSDASELNGRWEGGSSVSFGGGSSLTSRELNLKPDGTFSGATAASISSASDESVVSAGSHGGISGKWELHGYALVLTYDDGKVVRGVTFPFDDEKTPVYPDRFYFAGTRYKKLSS